MDELMEALTLIQTGKTRRIPIILVGASFWGGLLDWFRSVMVAESMIEAADMDLVQVIDEPKEVVAAIFKHYETSRFEPTPQEREIQLSL